MSAIIGSPAPTSRKVRQQEVSLSSFRGKKRVIIVFYPLDWSPVCTKEHACFVNDMKKFDQLDAQVIRAQASIASGRTKPTPRRWVSNIRCSPTFSRAAPSLPSTAFSCRIKASPVALSDHRPRWKPGVAQELRYSSCAGRGGSGNRAARGINKLFSQRKIAPASRRLSHGRSRPADSRAEPLLSRRQIASATRAASTAAFTSCVRKICAPLRISAVCVARVHRAGPRPEHPSAAWRPANKRLPRSARQQRKSRRTRNSLKRPSSG